MKEKRRFVNIGDLPTGDLNNICDVPGVLVGHYSVNNQDHHTGITAILPHEGNIFRKKVKAGSHVFNGFGKSVGVMQIEEMGTIETPILLTNTLNVGKVSDGLITYMLQDNKEIGVTTGTINPLVLECNDGRLNKIQERILGEKAVFSAIATAKNDFIQGSVGAGSGMICHGLKGGIGSSSRVITFDNKKYHLGVLVNTNFGASNSKSLIFKGRNIGEDIYSRNKNKNEDDKGSIIVVIATDIPLETRQLNRISKRAALGIARTGSFVGNGSGDIFVAFSTSNQTNHFTDTCIEKYEMLRDDYLEKVFKAVVFATEEAILNSMLYSSKTVGYLTTVHSITEYQDLYQDLLIDEEL
ncbi:MAG TPA: P1 family peptidase [Bacilli bacterium]|jgi:D-aminopeptidase|nr:P1 family peptidase [Acholeplasmataceae bacterium]HNZ78109.1 P1 family peptidase [Bacilli bacterium]HOH61966.1 P1 family peptidase [Bacilli bacterium]HPM15400.1 P1 family peptidase [Bacilli bacterium]HPY54197.1 P1 family peptidase [Bacilli bacterium]